MFVVIVQSVADLRVIMLTVVVLSLFMLSLLIQCHYTESIGDKSPYTECHYAECCADCACT